MKTIALTGGVGMGKSSAADVLRTRGVPVIDTDELAHRLVEPGQPALQEIEKIFGCEIIGAEGRLHRDKLADIVFTDAAAREKLEGVLHPRIARLWHEQVGKWSEEGKPAGVVVIPLLFETRADAEFDAVVCIACSAATQRQRLMTRGWTESEIEQRNAAQLPIEQKVARAHYVVWNEGNLDVLAEQLSRIVPFN